MQSFRLNRFSYLSPRRAAVSVAFLLWCGLSLGQVAGAKPAAETKPQAAENPAAQQAEGELKAKAAALVRQLDSDEIAKRDGAEKELIALGPDVVQHLPAFTPRMPGELRLRL